MNSSKPLAKIYLLFLLTTLVPFSALSQINTNIGVRQRMKVDSPKGNIDPKDDKQNEAQIELKLSPEISNIQYGKKVSNSRSIVGGTGVDGGGGNLRKGLPLSRNELESYLSNSNPNKYPTSVKKIIKYLFNGAYNRYTGLLFGYDPNNNPKKELILRNLHRKLFEQPDGPTIYSVLNSATIVLQDAPCLDVQTRKLNDASANVRTNSICLSWNRLSGKLFTNNFESYIIPLIAHEYFHLIGANEEEAKNLEDVLKKRASFEKVSERIYDLEDHITHYTAQLPEALKELRRTVVDGKPQSICIKSYKLHNLFSQAYDLFGTDEFFPLNPSEDLRVSTLDRRLLNLTKYCESTQMHELLEKTDDLVALDYAFQNGSREMSFLNFEEKIIEYYNSQKIISRLSQDQKRFLPLEGTISQVSDGNLEAVLSEVDKVISLVTWLSKETDVFELRQP